MGRVLLWRSLSDEAVLRFDSMPARFASRADAIAYLNRGRGLRYDGVNAAALTLGLKGRVRHAAVGAPWHVGHGYSIGPCQTLREAADHLLGELARQQDARLEAATDAMAAPAGPELPALGKQSTPAELCSEAAAMRSEAIQALASAVACPELASSAASVRSMAAQLTIQAERWEAEAKRREAAPGPALPALPSRFAATGFVGVEPWGNAPGFVTQSQQQQQPQQGLSYRQTVAGRRVAWDEPGETGAEVAAHNAALARKAAARKAAPTVPTVQTGPAARNTAPRFVPADVASLLQRFGLSLDGLLTIGSSNAKLAKGQAIAHPVILHHLPAKALASAVAGPEAGPTAPRSRIPGLYELAERQNVLALALAHNGCPWASAGCAAGCLAWAGHGGLSVTVASARARRTLAMLAGGPVYSRAVLWAIAAEWRKAQAKGLPLAVRLRGTDDLHWHLARFDISPAEAATIARRYGLPVAPGKGQALPEALSLAPAGTIRLYEYSKAPIDGAFGLKAQRAAGFDTTASLAADRPNGLAHALQAIAAGFRLAVPAGFAKGQPLPPVLLLRKEAGGPVVRLACLDGDITDHRWQDPQGPQDGGFDGVAVLLRTKRSRGRGPEADAFSLAPTIGAWQPLAGGGQAAFSSLEWPAE